MVLFHCPVCFDIYFLFLLSWILLSTFFLEEKSLRSVEWTQMSEFCELFHFHNPTETTTDLAEIKHLGCFSEKGYFRVTPIGRVLSGNFIYIRLSAYTGGSWYKRQFL